MLQVNRSLVTERLQWKRSMSGQPQRQFADAGTTL